MGWSDKLQRVFWVVLTACIIYYGNGKTNLISVMLFNKRIYRDYIQFGALAASLNAATYSYVYCYLYAYKGIDQPLLYAPWTVNMGGATMAGTIVAFMIGLWPVYSFLTPFVVVIVFFGTTLMFTFIPAFGMKRVTGMQSVKEE